MKFGRPVNLPAACILACALVAIPAARAGEDSPEDSPEEQAATSQPAADGEKLTAEAVAAIRAQMAAQQKQIEQLQKSLEAQQQALDRALNGGVRATPTDLAPPSSVPDSPFNRLGEVASRKPIIPLGTGASTVRPITPFGAPQGASADAAPPTSLRLGNAYFTPVGFLDMTLISRSTNPGTGIGTNFGSIPYSNTQAGALTETRLSVQNSRLGLRVDTGFHGYDVLGYWESDFLGQLGNPPNGGLAVSSNPYVFRLRLFWVDVTKGRFEFLAGQSWSLLTPNRKGVSPIPGDIFYSQDIDVNYQAGLVWGRIPGFRLAYHFNKKAVAALAFENSEPYVGGGNGGSAIVAPAAFAPILGSQLNNGASVISAPALFPDIIGKVAFDPGSKFHFEVAGVLISNKIANPASTPAFHSTSKAGGGVSVNLNVEVLKGLRVVTNNFWSSGGGRYIFGQAPDFTIRPNGDISLVHSASTVTGLEFTAGKTLFYGYYGGIFIDKNLALDANGKTPIGYGPIASGGQNRTIQEITFGTNTTLARDAKWGALNLMFQYSYLQRNPWLATGTTPHDAHLSMGFLNLRYTLPSLGSPDKRAR